MYQWGAYIRRRKRERLITSDGIERTTMTETLVQTNYGTLRGDSSDGISVWKGIPFAKSPIGNIRFRAPREPDPWLEVRDANRFGNAAMQIDSPLELRAERDEDCLYLNVWAPASNEKQLRPVMVWIHGGASLLANPVRRELSLPPSPGSLLRYLARRRSVPPTCRDRACGACRCACGMRVNTTSTLMARWLFACRGGPQSTAKGKSARCAQPGIPGWSSHRSSKAGSSCHTGTVHGRVGSSCRACMFTYQAILADQPFAQPRHFLRGHCTDHFSQRGVPA
jgi:hypothetical protein